MKAQGSQRSSLAQWLLIASAVLLLAAKPGEVAATQADTDPHDGLSNVSCEGCHAPKRISIVDPETLLKSVHKDEQCVDCHSDIEKTPHAKDLAPVVCADCHRKEAKPILKGAHAPGYVKSHRGGAPSTAETERRVGEGEPTSTAVHADNGHEAKEPPACVTCHGAHDVAEVKSAAFRNVIAGRCKQCHEERFATYMDRFHGKAGVLGMEATPRCHDCHTGHKPLPADNPESTVHVDHLVETCGQCHKQANDSFVQFDPHPQPHNKEHSALVYYWWVFMVALLTGTFGFFAIHDFLWLQRAVVAYFRGENRPLKPTGQWVRRFKPTDSASHVVLNITFMLLALTGLPLMFAQEEWAQHVAQVFGGQPVMRYTHFTTAAVFFTGFVGHLGIMFYRAVKVRGWALLWGVDSLVPWGPDFADMWHNFKWFIYVGERPKLGRWTYWEKFDYWAVFWGMAIIGVSGVMMANAELYARILPGEWLNVAAVIHGEEALLAVGFITLFHFFHNHLRPENFPMDITVFTGVQPLERFKEERPVQYERAVREGTLESMIVPPPSRYAIVFWSVYGTILVFLGFFLTFAVIYTILT